MASASSSSAVAAASSAAGSSGGKHKSRAWYNGYGAKPSRKISLTCQSVKPEFLIPAVPQSSIVVKGAALLDPARKSSGRLKSPLPSPIPSPSPSPIPSPSRSRFQVSRVQEGASLSPLTPPSSTSSSPTNSMSRFRVTTVKEAKSKTTVVVARSQAMSIPSGSGGNGSGNGSSGGAVGLGKSADSGLEKEQNIFFATTPPPQPPLIELVASGKGQGVTKGNSNKRLQSVSLDTISSSLDSPDLEVKRIMMLDDSSSIGSLDSYSAHHFVPPSATLSSTESLDVAEKRPVMVLPPVDPHQMSIDSSVESISEKCNNLVLQEPPQRKAESVKVEEKTNVARTRKTSWIPANQATIDKLMSIFQNPFSRQASPNDGHHQPPPPPQQQQQHQSQQSEEKSSAAVSEPCPQSGLTHGVAARKDNSLGNLFNWAASGMRKEEKDKEELVAVDVKQSVLLPNTRCESNSNTITGVKDVIGSTLNEVIQLDSDLMSDSLMNEIKENISPEHTITASSTQQPQQQRRSPLSEGACPSGENSNNESSRGELARVKFRLGSTEDFDDLLMAEDEELLMESTQRGGSSTGLTSDDSCLSLDVEGGIGCIARDSMVMFNTSGGGGSGSGGGGSNNGGPLKASSPIATNAE